jgi:hypothetical protein
MQPSLGATRIAVLIAAFALFLALAPSSAMANHVQCGDVITQGTTLDSDVVCTGETFDVTAITIAASGVTLDLGGHAIVGEASYEDPSSNGIATFGELSDITIRNGTVQGFSTGIRIETSDSLVERVFLDNGSAGLIMEGNDNVVLRNEVTNTGEFGYRLIGDRVRVERNVALGPGSCLTIFGDAPVVVRNVMTECWQYAGLVDDYTTATIARNAFTDSVAGLLVRGSGATIERNDLSRNNYFGLGVFDTQAVVDRNVANDNFHPSLSSDAVGDGIEIYVPGAVVSRNEAHRNENYGIQALPGTIDGGGNRARNNGNPAQCVGVRCK